MAEDRYLDIGAGKHLHYLEAGPAEGRPLVFVPGWGSSADVFRPQLAYFGAAGWHVLALDPRNHGGSSDDPEATTYAAQGADIAALVEALGLSGIVLAGWSFGAAACWEYLHTCGFAQVAGLVVVDDPPLPLAENREEYRGNSPEGFERQLAEYLGTEAGLARFVEEKFVDGIFFDEPPQDPVVRNLFVRMAQRVPLPAARSLFVDGHRRDDRNVMALAHDAVPCMFFVAKYRREQGLRCIPRDWPRARVAAFGNHMMFWEYPDRFNGELEGFLRDNGLVQEAPAGRVVGSLIGGTAAGGM